MKRITLQVYDIQAGKSATVRFEGMTRQSIFVRRVTWERKTKHLQNPKVFGYSIAMAGDDVVLSAVLEQKAGS